MPSAIHGKKNSIKLRIALALLTMLAMLAVYAPVKAATTLLPIGKTCFSNANGPLIAGSVYFYVPNTTTFKQTWQDSGQVTANPQPIPLDSNGCALIYGVGSYRQQVYTGADNTSTLVFDAVTTDTSAFNSVFWASLSGGTPNAITITYPGFNATDGTQINFVALNNNTGPVTLNPSSFGAISIVKDTTGGPSALAAGDIAAGNIVSVIYYTTDNRFHLVNPPVPSASGTTAPSCGFTGLVITNDSGTPNSIMDVTATQMVTQNSSGLIINHTLNATLNISLGTSTSTAGGMDGESPGTSAWIYVWGIDNGSSGSVIGSLSATAPTLPSGYTYKCRAGAIRVDGSTNLYRSVQKGAAAQWKVVATTNTASYFVAQNGSSGTCTAGNYTTVSIAAYVPPTSTQVSAIGTNEYNSGTLATVCISPNNGTGAGNSANPPFWSVDNTARVSTPFRVLLETSQTLFYAGNASGAALFITGWIDSVNAN